MILVDTSVWLDFFRDRHPAAEQVDGLLEANAVALCGPIETEIRRGLSVKERAVVLPLLAGCHYLTDPPDLWSTAGDIGFSLRRRGATVKTLDLLIATFAISADVPLLTLDRDFRLIQRSVPDLRLW